MPFKAWIGLGSNLGDRQQHIASALEHLEDAGLSLWKRSSLYETEPVGTGYTGLFLNGVVSLASHLSPADLLALLLATEQCLGRNRQADCNRTIDLDILLMRHNGQWLYQTSAPTLPHPRMFARSFVMEPLQELLQYDTIKEIRQEHNRLTARAKIRTIL